MKNMLTESMDLKLLVVDQDSQTIQFISDIFSKEQGSTIFSARTADIAIEMVWRKKPNIVVVNTQLLDLSGWEVLGILKKNEPTRTTPFIMLGDKNDTMEDEVRAFDLGADDYISKPFSADVFRARVKAVIHRYSNGVEHRFESEEILKSGNIVINMITHMVYVNGKPVDLTPKEFALLYLFVKKKNRVLNRVFLSGAIWEREYYQTSHTIDKHIANLRKKLGSEGEKIETLYTVGYKFAGEEELEGPEEITPRS